MNVLGTKLRDTRQFLLRNFALPLTVAFVAIAGTQESFAQKSAQLPEGVVNFIVPVAVGGGTDLTFRALVESAKAHLDRNIVVLNVPGAGNAIGLAQAAKKPGDGMNLTSYTSEVFTLPIFNQLTFSAKDFKPVILVNEDPACLVVAADSKLNTLEAFIAEAKAKPGKLTVGNSGYGNIWHLSAAAFAKKAGVQVLQIPYSGSAPTMQAVLGKQIDAFVASPPEVQGQVESGKLKILAVMSDKRNESFPNVPTLKERGIDLSMGTWRGIAVPAATPDASVKILHDGFAQAMQDKAFVEFMKTRGLTIHYMNTKDFTDFAARQRPVFEALATEVNKVKE
ncbi:MAG TPA: tripartite tricarboxylate transporter substrate binding protein [Burkholderiaceae bacterium]|jgi:tripartite-type tricarboxylate transporter receptor subunit TctC